MLKLLTKRVYLADVGILYDIGQQALLGGGERVGVTEQDADEFTRRTEAQGHNRRLVVA